MNLDKAWTALCEGDLPLLAEELGTYSKKEVDGNVCKKNEGLCETGGADDYTGGENSGITKEALGRENEKGRNS